jgi:hypothetical protein
MIKPSCLYEVDAQDRIISLGGAWTAFARENGGEKLLNNPPLGQPIWQIIRGLSTRNIYYLVMKQVRESGVTIRFPFRCDSPTTLRYMEMAVSPAENKGIYFQTTLTSVIERNTLVTRESHAPRQEPMVQICAWCDLVLVRSDWLSLEDAIWLLGLFDTPEAPPISHSICPACVRLLDKEVKLRTPR